MAFMIEVFDEYDDLWGAVLFNEVDFFEEEDLEDVRRVAVDYHTDRDDPIGDVLSCVIYGLDYLVNREGIFLGDYRTISENPDDPYDESWMDEIEQLENEGTPYCWLDVK